MSEFFILRTSIIFLGFWSLGIVLLWFRPRIEIFWKIIATLILAFVIYLCIDILQNDLDRFFENGINSLFLFLKEFFALLLLNLFFLWPVALVLIFYKADDIGAERLLKFMSIITLILLIIAFVYVFFSEGADQQILDNIKKIIPDGS